jgi:hypothetical protein
MKLAHLVLVAALASSAAAPRAVCGALDGAAAADTSAGSTGAGSKESIKREMARIGQAEVPGEREWERKKSPTVAMASSMVLPGLGQLYNGRRIKTIIAVGAFGYYLGTAWLEAKEAQRSLKARDALDPNTFEWREEDAWYQFHKESARDYLWWSGAVWLITVLDAFVDAHLYDVRAVKPEAARSSDGGTYVGFSVNF